VAPAFVANGSRSYRPSSPLSSMRSDVLLVDVYETILLHVEFGP
jgi:hypothetical protein